MSGSILASIINPELTFSPRWCPSKIFCSPRKWSAQSAVPIRRPVMISTIPSVTSTAPRDCRTPTSARFSKATRCAPIRASKRCWQSAVKSEHPPMSIEALGYIGVRSKDLDDWASYGANFLGLHRLDKTSSTLAFRIHDRKPRLVVAADGGQGIAFFGWEVADAAALDALAAKLEANDIDVARGSRALADERHVADLIVLHDPAGNRLEIFHGAQVAGEAFRPGRNISGFRTGPLGMGHVV